MDNDFTSNAWIQPMPNSQGKVDVSEEPTAIAAAASARHFSRISFLGLEWEEEDASLQCAALL
jgi:hypothetical protein